MSVTLVVTLDPGGDFDVDDPEWQRAAADAALIACEHPDWTVCPVRLWHGPGIAAERDPAAEGICAAVGTADEVRRALAEVPRQAGA